MKKIINDLFKASIEIFIFDKKLRAKIKTRWSKFWLKKYTKLAILDNRINNSPSNDNEKLIIWQYWHQGQENAPQIVKQCFESIKKYEGDKKINILSFDTIKDYVEIPQIYYDLLKSGRMKIAHFSDILRLYLLEKYGGVWIDSTILLTNKIPQSVYDSDFCTVQKNPKTDNHEDKMSCYFIRAKKGCKNLNAIKIALEAYWKENNFLLNYFIFENISTMLSDMTPELKSEWEKMPFISASDCGSLQELMKKDFDEEVLKEVKTNFFMHKLTYKN